MSQLNKNTEVFFTAFMKANPNKFFVCRGDITHTPSSEGRQVYKVKINAVALHPVGEKTESIIQASLLLKQITKKASELSKEPPVFMKPSGWIEIVR